MFNPGDGSSRAEDQRHGGWRERSTGARIHKRNIQNKGKKRGTHQGYVVLQRDKEHLAKQPLHHTEVCTYGVRLKDTSNATHPTSNISNPQGRQRYADLPGSYSLQDTWNKAHLERAFPEQGKDSR